jgi:putative heme-binding domain-containing protein
LPEYRPFMTPARYLLIALLAGRLGLSAAAPAVPGKNDVQAAPTPVSGGETTTTGSAPTPWGVDDLVPAINRALKAGGLNFERGERMFATAGCIRCHRFGENTGSFGPDLTGVAGRFSARDILQAVVEPSSEVAKTFFGTVVVHTADGKSYFGFPAGATERDFNLIESWSFDPQTGFAAWNGPTRRIRVTDILEVEDSGVSSMPTGLLDRYRPAEIADLVGYLLSQADPRSPLFQNRPPRGAPEPDRSIPAGALAVSPPPTDSPTSQPSGPKPIPPLP